MFPEYTPVTGFFKKRWAYLCLINSSYKDILDLVFDIDAVEIYLNINVKP
jgi:sporulation-control protein spo0M